MTVQEFATMSALEDAAKLEAFEALVQSQQPATQPWTPVTDYSFDARKQIESEHPRLIRETFGSAYTADIGCGPGHLVTLLREQGMDAHGFDPAVQSDRAIMFMDISVSFFHPVSRFDLVICREVLEHLTIRQIRQAVTNLCALSKRFVYVTTRFARTPHHLLDLDTSDDLDPDHRTMLNQSLLRLLFVLEGFTRRADLETQLDWQHKNRCLVYERA